MAANALSPNEQKTLHGLVTHPSANDRVLGLKIGLKMSTVTAIKNRLKRRGLFVPVRVPALERLGWETISFAIGRLNPLVRFSTLTKQVHKVVDPIPEIVHMTMDPQAFHIMMYHRKYSDLHRTMKAIEVGLGGNELLLRSIDFYHFPFDQSHVMSVADHAPPISAVLGRKFDVNKTKGFGDFAPPPQRHLTRVERTALLGLVKHTTIPDNRIAQHIGVTRQSVTKMRKRFEREGLMQPHKVPDLRQLGIQLEGIAYFEWAPDSTFRKRRKQLGKGLPPTPVTTLVAQDGGAFVRGFDTSIESLQTSLEGFISTLAKENMLRRTPDVLFLDHSRSVDIKFYQYTPLMEKYLSGDED